MCTVSTSLSDDAFVVTMNRDEQRARLEGPLHCDPHHCYPTDDAAGGTWCGINRQGFIFCLLNRYDAPLSDASHIISRGGIIPMLLTCADLNDIRGRLRNIDLDNYNGFRLLVLSREACEQHDWDRSEYSVTPFESPGDVFSSSSSVQSLVIPQQRERRYRQWRKNAESAEKLGKIPSIHLHEPSVTPNESIFMVRERTHTKSICQFSVQDGLVSLMYWPAQNGFDSQNSQKWSASVVSGTQP